MSEIGLQDKLVGVSSYCRASKEICKKPRIGSALTPKTELILSLKANIIVGTSKSDLQLKEKLKVQGARYIALKQDKLEDYPNNLRLFQSIAPLSRVLSLQKKWAQRISELEIIDVKTKIKVLLDYKNRVVVGRGHISEALRLCGVQNSFEEIQTWKQVSVEKILHPRRSILILQNKKEPEVELEKAIKPKTVYYVSQDKFSLLNQAFLESTLMFCKKLASK